VHHALLREALAIAVRIAEHKPQIVREILATGAAEGLVVLEGATVTRRLRISPWVKAASG
jgi:hypothetical protein